MIRYLSGNIFDSDANLLVNQIIVDIFAKDQNIRVDIHVRD